MLLGELILHCFHARTNAHVLHLTTKSYAVHVALNGFYDEIITLADSLAEAGSAFGLLTFPDVPYEPAKSADDLLDTLLGRVDEYIEDTDEGHLISIAEEIKALVASTLYKLRFLK